VSLRGTVKDEMRGRGAKRGLLALLVAGSAIAWPSAVAAEPVDFAHGTIDQRFTTTQPNAPSGFTFDGRYHAAGNPDGDPPYMRRMTSYPPRGLRYDTSVPERCSASDLQLAVFGASACPEGSRLGGGDTDTKFVGRFESNVQLDLFNNTDEQIIVVRSPFVATVSRGRIHPDGSVEFASPTCFPALQPPGCPVDSVLQLRSHVEAAPYTRSIDGVVRSWLTTPPKCPASGRWQGRIRLWWADGSEDTVVTRYPCTRQSSIRLSSRRSCRTKRTARQRKRCRARRASVR
jgi:hypothetical protein